MGKYAFLVGINRFKNPSATLYGCVNDVVAARDLLNTRFGFALDDMPLLFDEKATRANILAGLQHLLNQLSTGDTGVFYVASHGTQKNFGQTEEEDGRDEAIMPYEADYHSLITDDELFRLITSKIQDTDISFTAVYDCCHSGTMVRDIEFGEDGELIIEQNRSFFVPLPEVGGLVVRSEPVGPYNVFSACQDSETAADLRIDGVPRGAFSYALQSVIADNPKIQMGDLNDKVLPVIKSVSKHNQNPVYTVTDNSKSVFAV